MKTLFTIGYEGALFADFLATLRAKKVGMLIDVREVPASRKPGFSKQSLARRLENAGIDYLHLRDLGDPKPGRDAARRGDFDLFEQIYRRHLARECAQAALSEAATAASAFTACLLCFERDPKACHRTIVAEAMIGLDSFRVRHLGVPAGLAHKASESYADVHGTLTVG